MKKRIKEVKRIVKNEGLDVINIKQGKHLSLTVTDGSVVFSVTTPFTPSCNRTFLQMRSDLRRGIREAQKKPDC